MQNFEWTAEKVKDYGEWFRKIQGDCPTELWGKDLYEEYVKLNSPKEKKNYTILSFLSAGIITTRNDDGTFGVYYASEKSLTSSSVHTIHSVKRNSDGKIFTVGDKVQDPVTRHVWNINEFTTKDTRCFAEGQNISFIEKIHDRLPFFITEDGKEIFMPTRLFFVSIENKTMLSGYVNKTPTVGDFHYVPQKQKYFSTKEAAEEYILMNKPLLSLNDLLSVWNHPVDISNENKESPLLSRFKDLAKSKLNP